MGDQGDQLGARLVEALQRDNLGLGLALLTTLLDDPGEEVGDRAQLGGIGRVEVAHGLRLDVEHADDLVVPRQRHRQHRRHVAALVDPADPHEMGILLDVGHDHRLLAGCHPTGDALAERHPCAPDLVAIEAVRGGQGQMAAVAVEEVERADVGVQGVAGFVDDRLEELVPGPGRGGQAGDPMQEAELPELLLGRAIWRRRGRDHAPHGTGGR